MIMKVSELRVKTSSELTDIVVKLRQELMNLRFQRVNGQLTNPARFRGARREIARIKTVMAEQKKSAAKGV